MPQRDFLTHFGAALTERVATACPPIYRGPSDTPWAPLALLKRKPLGAQGLIAQAGAAAIRGLRAQTAGGGSHGENASDDQPAMPPGRRRRRGLGLVAEMATGKTLLSLAILGLADEDVTRRRATDAAGPEKAAFFPAVVLCPPIVAGKWAREATQTLPTARPVVIRPIRTKAELAAFRQFDPMFSGRQLSAIGCVERVATRIRAELAQWKVQRETAMREGRTPPRKPCHIAILSTSTAKLGPAWTPVYVLRALRDTGDAGTVEGEAEVNTAGSERSAGRVRLLRDPATGEPYVVPCCPRCFSPLTDDTRADRLDRRRQQRRRRAPGRGGARGSAGDGGEDAGQPDEEEEALDVYLREGELLGEAGSPRAKRTCSACGEPLWQVIPDGVAWQSTPPPLPGLGAGRAAAHLPRPLPLPSRERHPPCLTSTFERRYPLADYLRKRHRGLFRSVICDEAHQFKGASTAQGFAAASLVDACNPGGTALFLTGTLFSGYASDLYPMLWRLLPELRQTFGYGDLKRWVDLYGVRQKVVKVREPRPGHREDGAVSKRREDRPLVKELPGISPLVLRHLLDSCLFLELADVAPGLPPYSEQAVVVPMGETLGPIYEQFERETTTALKELLAHEDHSGLAAWFQGLMIQPNLPWRGFTAVSSHGVVLGAAEPLPEATIYPKEQALLDLVRRERADGRRALVYVEHTGEYDLLPRLKALIEADDAAWREEWVRSIQNMQAPADVCGETEEAERPASAQHSDGRSGMFGSPDLLGVPDVPGVSRPPTQRVRVAILRSGTVASGEREAWLQRAVEQGCDVLLCHSGLVEVGLDLLAFPTIVCDEVIFSTTRVRQATRRSYRPGQTQPVRVVQLVYDRSMEARGLQLIARKIKSSLMVEGKLPGEGLAAFGQGEDQGDLLIELARSVLADEDGGARDVAGSLEATFRELAAAEEAQDGYIGDVEVPAVVDEAEDEDAADTAVAALDGAGMRPETERPPRDAVGESTRPLVSSERAVPTGRWPMIVSSESDALQRDWKTGPAPTHVDAPADAAPVPSADDPWARWRELQRQAQLRPMRRRPRGGERAAAPDRASEGSLWAMSAVPAIRPSGTARSGQPGGSLMEDVPPGDGQPVQAALWADE